METYQAVIFLIVLAALLAELEFASLFTHPDRPKYGIKLFSEPLPEDMRVFFTKLTDDYIEAETGAFIRKRSNKILVQHLRFRKYVLERNGFACVAWADLDRYSPKLEYRVPFSFLTLIPWWFLVAVWISIEAPGFLILWGAVLGVWYFWFRYHKRRIADFVKRASQTVRISE